MGLQKLNTTKFEKDQWFDKKLEAETDWVEAYEKRHCYVGRYSYIFEREKDLLEPFEQALKWFLEFEGYQELWSMDTAVFRQRRMAEIEDKVDNILDRLKIPLQFVDSMRKATKPRKYFREVHTMVQDGICQRCKELYIYCDCDPEIEYLEVKGR